jgi:hypothetical protein
MPFDVGDICIADVRAERRLAVLVVSVQRFNELSGRVWIAPSIDGPPEDGIPWRIATGEYVFALDRLISVPTSQLLERAAIAPEIAVAAARRALRLIT